MRKIVSRELGTSVVFDDVELPQRFVYNTSRLVVYTESRNIYRENFRVQGSPSKICRTMTK